MENECISKLFLHTELIRLIAQAEEYLKWIDPNKDEEKYIQWSTILNERQRIAQMITDMPTIRNKDIPKRPVIEKFAIDMEGYFCPNCGKDVLIGDKHCKECGQKLDWRVDD